MGIGLKKKQQQTVYFIKGKVQYILQTSGEGKKQLWGQVIIVSASDWSGTSSFITQIQLLETLDRPRMAPGEVTTVHAQVLMTGHV